MQVSVTLDSVTVDHVDVMTSLSVVTPLQASEAVGILLADGLARECGAASDEYVWLDVATLALRSGLSDDLTWCRTFEAMIDYAAGRGWTGEDRAVVRAHLDVRT